jgi:hypothetical protein
MLDIVWNPPVPMTVKGFQLTFQPITIPVEEIRGIVENHFVCYTHDFSDDGNFEGFNKINAIKELRSHFQLQTSKYYTMYGNTGLNFGLREAKDMVDAVYNEGIETGKYRGACHHASKYDNSVDIDTNTENAVPANVDLPF